jgi:hypothetical protein
MFDRSGAGSLSLSVGAVGNKFLENGCAVVSFREDMALAWGGIFAGIGAISLWAAVDSRTVEVQALLAVFGLAMVGFGAYTMVRRTWPTES